MEWQNFKLAKNQAAAAVKAGKVNYYKLVLEDSRADIWHKITIVRGFNNTTNCKIEKLVSNNTTYNNSSQIANELNDHFSNIGMKLNQHTQVNQSSSVMLNSGVRLLNSTNGFAFSIVENSTVSKTLSSLKGRKSGGIYQVPRVHLPHSRVFDFGTSDLYNNLAIELNVFPNCWKEALVLPLHKGGDPKLPTNYRPISLLPILGKVFEKILSSQMCDYFNFSKFGLGLGLVVLQTN